MTTAVKRACDACHRRKVKCDGINPCRNCSSAQLSCTYNAIPQKKGPKGSRAKVISELRETQRQTSLATKVHNRLNGAASPPASPTLSPTPGLLTKEMVKECVEFYFNNMYPLLPILQRQQLEQDAMAFETNLDIYCLLTSLCAFMMLQPGMGMPGGDPYGLDSMPGANIVSGTLLMEETIRVRKAFDYLESPTLNSLCTSYLLFACYYGIELHDKAWFHLREATTVAHMIGMNKEDSYLSFDNASASRRRRLYWMLFITERAYALQRHRPLTLQATINLPTLGDDPSDPLAHQLNGFVLLVNLFRPFNDQLVNLWNKTKADCNSSYIGVLQKQLTEVLPTCLSVADPQLADTRTNQTWLKNITWQLSMSGHVNGSDPNLSSQYPIDMSRELVTLTSAFSTQNMELISGGFVAKLFEVASSLVDVLSLQPASRDPFSMFNPVENLQQVLNLVGVVRNGESRFLPLLLSKMNEVIPRLINPMLQNMPENACSVDIFDGFGNAGMAQPPSMGLDEFDHKFSVPRIDEFKQEPPSSNGGPPSVPDIKSPFVTSPPVLSPGLEFAHGLPQDFGPMSDMVMSPVGPGPTPGQGNGPQLSTPGGVVVTHHQQHSLPHQQHAQHPPQAHAQQQQQQQQQQHRHHHHHHHQQKQQQQQSHHQQQQGHHQHHHQQSHQQPPIPTLQSMSQNNMNAHFQGNILPGMSQPQSMNMGPQTLPPQVQAQVMNGALGQGFMGQGMPQGMAPNGNMMMRQQPQRANSYALQSSQLRTVADFQALQRTNSDMSAMNTLPMNSMGTEIDFNTLPR